MHLLTCGRCWSYTTMSPPVWPLLFPARTSILAAGSIFDTEIDKRPRWKARVASHVEGIRASVIVLFFTFLALFMDDFRLLALPPSLDGLCEVLACLILVSCLDQCKHIRGWLI